MNEQKESMAMGIIKAIFIIVTIVGPALAQKLVTITSFAEFVKRLAYQYNGEMIQPEHVAKFKSDSRSREHLQNQFDQLADRSLPVIRQCGHFSKFADQCIAVPYRLLFLGDSDRNAMLGRPSPDIVRINIEQATHNELSTVGGLVEKVLVNLATFGNLSILNNDKLTLLGSNFHHSKPGWFTGEKYRHLDNRPWTNDLLILEDKQRALAAGFLYVSRDPGYRE